MGLDVYMYFYESFDDTRSREERHDKESEACWEAAAPGKTYAQMTEGEKEDARSRAKALATSLGLDEDGACPRKRKIEIDSSLHPDHYFKVGYFRSSYNESGINRTLHTALGDGHSLDAVFGVTRETPYVFLPNWSEALERARALRDQFTASTQAGAFRVTEVDFFVAALRPNEAVAGSDAALKRFLEVKKDHDARPASPIGGSFSNGYGHFFLDKEPLRVRAVLAGKRESVIARVMGAGVREEPVAYVVYEPTDGFAWHRAALDVVVETCEWVLAQAEPEKHYLHWSA